MLLAVLCCLTGAPPVAGAQQMAPRYVLLESNSRIWFEARATLGSFQGVAGEVHGWARFTDRDRLEGASAEVRIGVASFRTGNGTRDRHLRETMEVDSFPHIVWRLMRARAVSAEDDGRAAVELSGTLTIKGTTREVVIPTELVFLDDTVRASGSLPIRLTDYGIPPPRRVIGIVRMSNDLVLRFDAAFVGENAVPAPRSSVWSLPSAMAEPHISGGP